MDDDSIREALARRRPVPRGDSWCWIPKPYDSVFRGGVRARRAKVETAGSVIWWSGVAAVFRRIVFAAAARVGRKRPIRRRVASRGTRVDRSIDRSRSVGRGVAWVTGGGARSTEGRAAAVGVSVRVPLGRTRRCRCRASSRVESMDGTNANANANASRTRGDAGRRPRATPFRNARVIGLID